MRFKGYQCLRQNEQVTLIRFLNSTVKQLEFFLLLVLFLHERVQYGNIGEAVLPAQAGKFKADSLHSFQLYNLWPSYSPVLSPFVPSFL
jgi:hypothetical protein